MMKLGKGYGKWDPSEKRQWLQDYLKIVNELAFRSSRILTFSQIAVVCVCRGYIQAEECLRRRFKWLRHEARKMSAPHPDIPAQIDEAELYALEEAGSITVESLERLKEQIENMTKIRDLIEQRQATLEGFVKQTPSPSMLKELSELPVLAPGEFECPFIPLVVGPSKNAVQQMTLSSISTLITVKTQSLQSSKFDILSVLLKDLKARPESADTQFSCTQELKFILRPYHGLNAIRLFIKSKGIPALAATLRTFQKTNPEISGEVAEIVCSIQRDVVESYQAFVDNHMLELLLQAAINTPGVREKIHLLAVMAVSSSFAHADPKQVITAVLTTKGGMELIGNVMHAFHDKPHMLIASMQLVAAIFNDSGPKLSEKYRALFDLALVVGIMERHSDMMLVQEMALYLVLALIRFTKLESYGELSKVPNSIQTIVHAAKAFPQSFEIQQTAQVIFDRLMSSSVPLHGPSAEADRVLYGEGVMALSVEVIEAFPDKFEIQSIALGNICRFFKIKGAISSILSERFISLVLGAMGRFPSEVSPIITLGYMILASAAGSFAKFIVNTPNGLQAIVGSLAKHLSDPYLAGLGVTCLDSIIAIYPAAYKAIKKCADVRDILPRLAASSSSSDS